MGVMLVHRTWSSPAGKGVPGEGERGMYLAGQKVMKVHNKSDIKALGRKNFGILVSSM